MTSIGGFFELELRKEHEYLGDLTALNTGRNALEFILLSKRYKRVFIPFYTCDVILEPFKRTGTEYVFYAINEQLELVKEPLLEKGDALLYTNYFGVKNKYVKELSLRHKELIIDNSQSFYSKPLEKVSTFFSCRKFFGVPDGAYVSIQNKELQNTLEKDITSYERFEHLTKRIDMGPEEAYADFKKNDLSLVGQPVKLMSELTHSLMKSIDYEKVRAIRNRNFEVLAKELEKENKLKIELIDIDGPMVYPFLTNKKGLREILIKEKIFVAAYWPNINDWCAEDSLESELYSNLLALPVDQRYTVKDMERILKILLK